MSQAPGPSRRLDWSLLLPDFGSPSRPDALVLGGPDSLGEQVVDQGLADTWRRPRGPSDTSLLVLSCESATDDPRRVAQRVEPGGTLYLEVDRTRRGSSRRSPRRVRRVLEQAGLTVRSAHWVSPTLAAPRRYVPLDATEPLAWHLRTLFIAGGPAMRLAHQGLILALRASSLVSRVGRRDPGIVALQIVCPRFMMIAERTDGANSSENSTENSTGGDTVSGRGGELTASPAQARPPAPLGPSDSTIVLTSGHDSGSRTVLLPFAPSAVAPRCAIKVANRPELAAATVREHERLRVLHAQLPQHVADGLPSALGVHRLGRHDACVESCAPGPSMLAVIGRWGGARNEKRRALDSAVDWLSRFGQVTASGQQTSLEWPQVFGQAAQLPTSSPAVVDLLLCLAELAEHAGITGVAVQQHFDFGPWNLYLSDDGLTAIDWELDHLRPTDCLGPPVADALYLAAYWYFVVSRARTPGQEEQAFHRLFVDRIPSDWAVLAARGAIDRHLRDMGLSRTVVPPILGALWSERALYTARRRALLGADQGCDTSESRAAAHLRILANSKQFFISDHGAWAD